MVKKKTTPKRKKVLLSSFNDGQGGSGQHNKISQRVDVALPNNTTTNTNIKPNDNDGQDGPSSSSSSLLALSSSVVGGMESSSSSSLPLPSLSLPLLPPLPPIGKFQKTERKQTNHEKELYCVAWSDDSYVKERNSNKSKQSTTSGDDDNKGDGEQQVRYYVFATCGANKVSLYEVQVNNNPNSNNNKNSNNNNNNKGMELLTCYTDNDTHEAFFACVFGGRSTMSYHQLQKNNNNNNHYHSSSSTVDNHDDDDDDDDDLQRQNSHIDSSTSNFSGSTSASNNNKTTTTTTTCCSSSNNDVQTEVGKKRPRTMEESVYTVGGHHRSSQQQQQQQQQHQKRQFELDHYYPQLLCVAGQSGRIKVIDPVQGKIIVQLYGHGHEIYDLRISPTNEYHMLSASVDESIRLWNLQSFACVAIFTGQHGHKEAVLSVSWHPCGNQFASSGQDKHIRIWNLDEPRILEALAASERIVPSKNRTKFHPLFVQFPCFATKKVHINFVDCVQFMASGAILSKSTYNSLILWIPDPPEATTKTVSTAYKPPSGVIVLRTFELRLCDLWFMRFTLDPMQRLLAIGNRKGEVEIWELEACEKLPTQRLSAQVHSTIRMVSFSPDGRSLVACDDSANVCKWDMV